MREKASPDGLGEHANEALRRVRRFDGSGDYSAVRTRVLGREFSLTCRCEWRYLCVLQKERLPGRRRLQYYCSLHTHTNILKLTSCQQTSPPNFTHRAEEISVESAPPAILLLAPRTHTLSCSDLAVSRCQRRSSRVLQTKSLPGRRRRRNTTGCSSRTRSKLPRRTRQKMSPRTLTRGTEGESAESTPPAAQSNGACTDATRRSDRPASKRPRRTRCTTARILCWCQLQSESSRSAPTHTHEGVR